KRGGLLSSPTRNRLAVLAVLLAVLTGCGQGQLPQGPLGSQPENHDTVGQPVLRGGAGTIGIRGVYNRGAQPAGRPQRLHPAPPSASSPSPPPPISLTAANPPLADPSDNAPPSPPSFPPPPRPRQKNGSEIGGGPSPPPPAGAVIPPHQLAGLALGLSATAAHG